MLQQRAILLSTQITVPWPSHTLPRHRVVRVQCEMVSSLVPAEWPRLATRLLMQPEEGRQSVTLALSCMIRLFESRRKILSSCDLPDTFFQLVSGQPLVSALET